MHSPAVITTNASICSSIAGIPLVSAYRQAVGEAMVAGDLPSGLEFEAHVDDFGLLHSLIVKVTECPVIVIDAPAVLATRTKNLPLNRTGATIQKFLTRLAGGLPEKIHCAVSFAGGLLQRQAAWVLSLPSGISLEPKWRPASEKKATDTATPQRGTPLVVLADSIRPLLAGGQTIAPQRLYHLADSAFAGTQAGGTYLAKDAYEAMEAAAQRHILDMGTDWAPTGTMEAAIAIAAQIDRLAGLLPNQTRRDSEMQDQQQFSTPAGVGFACAWAADIRPEDVVFEPSAGTGALAVHARNAGPAAVHVNEISPRRLAALRYLSFEPTAENAEQAHNIFASRLRPTRILMNPPFSKTIRTSRKCSAVAGEHVQSALKLLADGGRLVAITGKNVGAWIRAIKGQYALRASISLDGGLFAASGTRIETRVLVIDKVSPDGAAVAGGHAKSVEELITLLAPVRQPQADVEEAADTRFTAYVPAKFTDALALPHPGKLVESHAMAAIQPPDVSYCHRIPDAILTNGALSLAQLEIIAYAGQAHSQFLPHGERRGFFVGDGTGVGKSHEGAGIIADNWAHGREKHIWVTKDHTKLLKAAKKALGVMHLDPRLAFPIDKTPLGQSIKNAQGVLVVGQGTLRVSKPGKASRVDQIVEWVGENFEGVLLLDEAHKMGNCLERKGERGLQSPSQVALAGIELQQRLPRARVVYLSATGADQAMNLAYCDRLGIWGPGTPFPTKRNFVEAIENGGVAAMEIVARDLKAMGLYCARSLSYADVRYERLIHQLTPEQERTYNTLAEAWQLVLLKVDQAMNEAQSSGNAAACSAAMSAFWGAHQRFFNQVLISMQMPSVLQAVEADLKAGHAPVLQLVNTLEAATTRALAAEGAMENLEDLDLTPREVLMQFLQNSFPVRVYEKYEDEDGNLRSRQVFDALGNPVFCQEAIRMRDGLLEELGTLAVPQGPLEMLLDHFGVEQVAEITGRSQRIVYLPDPQTGAMVRKVEKRSESHRMADMEAFAQDRKRILIFSQAGGTGVDFHAALDIPNQRLRRHYVLQAGWSAKEAVQGLGRTHRSFQKQAPVFILVTTNLRGQLRFITSVARRLGQLGALTKGQRDTGSQGLFSERDNLEGPYGESAVFQMVCEMAHRQISVAGMNFTEFQRKLGLRMVDDEGNLALKKIPSVRQFLNRLLSLTIDDQNAVFDDFNERVEDNIQAAVDAGTYNEGVEVYRADRIEEISAPREVYVEPTSGASTQYVHLRAWHKRSAWPFERVIEGDISWGNRRKILGFVKPKGERSVWAVAKAKTLTDQSGKVVPQVRLVGPFEQKFLPEADVFGRWVNYEAVEPADAAAMWQAQSESGDAWRTIDLHLLIGVLLPIWDRISGSGSVYRLSTENGASYLGRLIHPGQVRQTLGRLGAGVQHPWTAEEVCTSVLAGGTITLCNGWTLRSTRVSNERRIELHGFFSQHVAGLKEMGLKLEMISYKTRLFVPTGDLATLEKLLKTHPVAEDDADGQEMAA